MRGNDRRLLRRIKAGESEACAQFVRLYYRHSPPVAKWLEEHHRLCRILRVLLVRPLSRLLDTARTEEERRDGNK